MSYATFVRFEIIMDEDTARACSQPGRDAAEDVDAALRVPMIEAQLDAIPADAIRAELREYGAWDDAELADDAENRKRIVWIAACDIREALAKMGSGK